MRRNRMPEAGKSFEARRKSGRSTWLAPLAAGVFACGCLAWFAHTSAPAAELDDLDVLVAVRAPLEPPAPRAIAPPVAARFTSPSPPADEPAPVLRFVSELGVSAPVSATPVEPPVALPVVARAHASESAPSVRAPEVAPPAPELAPRAPAPPPAKPASPTAPASVPTGGPGQRPASKQPRARPTKNPPSKPTAPTSYPRGFGPPLLGGMKEDTVPGGGGGGGGASTPSPGGGSGPSTGNPSGPTTGGPGVTRRPTAPSGETRGTETFGAIDENAFQLATQDTFSTFSIDVDTASYALVRRFLANGELPPRDAVRIEELLNYFRYDYPAPEGRVPFSFGANVATCPWEPAHTLVQIGLRGRDIDLARRPASNLVFLIDVSGSMESPDKLPLLVSSLKLLVRQLDGRDTLAIVVYAGNSGLVLPATSCDHQRVIANALDELQAGGSTNGGAGIELAYSVARANRIAGGQNRVILCTDGDFNVGTTSLDELQELVERERKSGVFLSVLGFGQGNTQDATMELLADKGDGNYAYVDTFMEAQKVLVHELGGTLVTIAQDVKLQVEFNPALVQAWRLVGYENRVLAHADFDDDRKDAGEIGAGHTVTALYEVVPAGVAFELSAEDRARQHTNVAAHTTPFDGELLKLQLRYKQPGSALSQLLTTRVRDAGQSWQEASADFKFAAAVASFGLVLRKSPHAGEFTLQRALNLAVQGVGADEAGYRKEFIELVRKAQAIERDVKR